MSEQKTKSALARASITLALLSFAAIAFMQLIVFVTLPLAIILGIISLIQFKKRPDNHSGKMLVVIALFLCFIQVVIISKTFLRAREYRHISSCMGGLKAIGLILKMYVGDRNETYSYPPDFRGLAYHGGKRSAHLYVCTGSGNIKGNMTNVHEWTDYVYVANLTDYDSPDVPIVLCPPENHKGKSGLVLFLDGHVESFYPDAFDDLINLSTLPKEVRDRAKILRATKQIKKKP